MLVQQVHVECGRADSLRAMVVWVDTSWNVKEGNVLEFRDYDGSWLVKKVYETKIDAANLNIKWGLALPKSQRTER